MDTLYSYYHKIIYEYGGTVEIDPRTADLPMSGSPMPIAILLIVYWVFVKKIGPAWMKNRPAYDLKPIIQAYNLLQVALCALFSIRALYLITSTDEDNLRCLEHTTTSPHDMACVYSMMCYGYIKMLDLVDTVFFVLRKRFNLITTLHTYHHIMMVAFTYIYSHYAPGGEVIIMAVTNSLVHTVMYSYYYVCLNSSNKENIWWKKYITTLQLAQFCFFLIWYTPKLFNTDCDYPKSLLLIFVTQAIVMIKMFGGYYYNAFIKPKKH